MLSKFFSTLLFVIISTNIFAQELPKANIENSFYILPLYAKSFFDSTPFEEKEFQYLKMKQELGNGNLYHRLGFSFIYTPPLDAAYRDDFILAKKYGLHLGLIFALQSHTRVDYRAIADNDLRQYQWRKDGEEWEGSLTNSGTLEIAEGERNYRIPTPSRLATNLRDYNFNEIRQWAKGVLNLMETYPGVVTCVNGPIEEELAIGGINSIKMADYSPFAITEFRDWLRHSNIYDASTGEYAGEGAISLIIGDLIDFNGTMRSQFYDDPTPANSNGTGISFNEFFGTDFQTWCLRYWDLTIYPAPITAEDFDVSPEAGQGFTANGFDAPRILENAPFWNAWSYDIPDQGGQYPQGNPSTPAFGFRQNMVRNFIGDLFDILVEEGIPENLLYAHQIPGEALDNFTGEAPRNRSSASPVWTGYLEEFQTVGITRFGSIDPEIMTQYADDWGIFEWHTLPFSSPASQQLYDVSIQALNNYYENKCHILFPGWWYDFPPVAEEIFPLNDSKFSEAIGDFMEARTEVPYHQQGNTFDYSPPQVNDVQGIIKDEILEITWDSIIWPKLLPKWSDWGQFDFFEVQWSEDDINWNATTTTLYKHAIPVEALNYAVRVRVNATTGQVGPWSEIVQAAVFTGEFSLQLSPAFDSLFFDPNTKNPVVVSLSNPDVAIIADSLQLSITGDGISLNTMPENVEDVEFFWPMDSKTEGNFYSGLDNIEFYGGILSATVSATTPVDPYFYLNSSALNGEELPYVRIRMYAATSTVGELFWFHDGGFNSVVFNIEAGWNVYQMDNVPDWISQQEIINIRLDPGTTGLNQIMVDWIAVSSQPILDQLTNAFYIKNQEVVTMTAPYEQPGSYTVTVDYKGASTSVIILTDIVNTAPNTVLLLPTTDTIIELGNTIQLNAIASDIDGYVKGLRFLANEIPITELLNPPYTYEWTPENTGILNINAASFDNNNETGTSNLISLEVREQLPYLGEPHQVPGRIEAEDYDLGGEFIAFWDTDAANQGNEYRNDGVDVDLIENEFDQYYLGWTAQEEWLEYTIDVMESTKMEFNVNIASAEGAGEFYFEMDGIRICNNQIVNSTGGNQIFTTYRIEDIFMRQGIHKLKLVIGKGDFNINYIDIQVYQPPVAVANENFDNNTISLYPNPAKNELTFSTQNKKINKIEIYSTAGQLIKTYQFLPTEKGTVNISTLPAGMYILHLFSSHQFWGKKIIK